MKINIWTITALILLVTIFVFGGMQYTSDISPNPQERRNNIFDEISKVFEDIELTRNVTSDAIKDNNLEKVKESLLQYQSLVEQHKTLTDEYEFLLNQNAIHLSEADNLGIFEKSKKVYAEQEEIWQKWIDCQEGNCFPVKQPIVKAPECGNNICSLVIVGIVFMKIEKIG